MLGNREIGKTRAILICERGLGLDHSHSRSGRRDYRGRLDNANGLHLGLGLGRRVPPRI